MTQRWSSPVTNYSAYAIQLPWTTGECLTTGFMSDGYTDGRIITLKYDSAGDFMVSALHGSTRTH